MPAEAALAFVDHHLVMAAERPRGAETRDTCADDGNSHGCPRMNLRRSVDGAGRDGPGPDHRGSAGLAGRTTPESTWLPSHRKASPSTSASNASVGKAAAPPRSRSIMWSIAATGIRVGVGSRNWSGALFG